MGGFEPPASTSRTWRAAKLRYIPVASVNLSAAADMPLTAERVRQRAVESAVGR